MMISKRNICILSLTIIMWACGNEGKDKQNTNDTTTQNSPEKEQTAPIIIDKEATARAYMLAAKEIEDKAGLDSLFKLPNTEKHYQEFNKSWQKLEDTRLSKMRLWSKAELGDWSANNYNLFYPFSGPDFINAYELFPNCDNYLLFGLEQAGDLPDLKKIKTGYLDKYLFNIRDALAEIFERNYFITSFMSGDLNIKYIKGVLPLINVFLARTDNKIVKIERFYLDSLGKPNTYPLKDFEKNNKKTINGITIEFINKNKKKTQKLYYIGTDLEDKVIPQKQEVVKFVQSFNKKIALIKSASYLLHGYNFSTIRNLILEDTKACLQDDTGIPYSFYKEAEWDVQLYGKYDRPIADFKYGFQTDLNKRYQTDSTIKTLDFTFGYHWKTDKTSLLFCIAPKTPKPKKEKNNAKNTKLEPKNDKINK